MKRFKNRKKYKIVSKKDTTKLEKTARKQIAKANAKLKSLRRHKGVKRSYASKILYNKLSIKSPVSISKTGIIKLKKGLGKTALNLIVNVVTNFLNSITSTYEGIKNIREKTKQSLYDTLSDINNDITEEDIDDLYDLFGTDSMDYFTERIGASALEIAVIENRKLEGDLEYFISILTRMGLSSDEDMRYHATNIYNKLFG